MGKGKVRTELEFSIRFVIEPGVEPDPEELAVLDRCLALVQQLKQHALPGMVKVQEIDAGGSMMDGLKQRALALADETTITEAARRVGIHPRTLGNWKRREDQRRRVSLPESGGA